MRMMTFAKRCSKEILRDPINLGFGLGFPLVLLVLLSAIQANIPVSRGCILLRLRDLTLSWDICSRYYLLLSDRF